MALIARTSAKTAARRSAATPVALVGANVELRLAGEFLTALPEGALWVHSAEALIVSDLHLEKGSSYAARGALLPPYDTRVTLQKLQELIDDLEPRVVVSLGDSFHDVGGPSRMDSADVAALRALTARCDWVWILGNHDPLAPVHLGGRVCEEIYIGGLTFRHEPQVGADEGEIAGHLHPCAKVVGKGVSVRRRCFAFDGTRLVMPAFGAYTGGLNVRHSAFAPLFPEGLTALVLSNKRVFPAGFDRLAGDV